MPKINFSFQGSCRADINKVTVIETGEVIDVSGFASDDLIARLDSGEFMISLGDHLYTSRKTEIEMHDFEKGD